MIYNYTYQYIQTRKAKSPRQNTTMRSTMIFPHGFPDGYQAQPRIDRACPGKGRSSAAGYHTQKTLRRSERHQK
tara:strand:+ start:239765 stop:239986 length:222 start_codon:yes stop_codon:yes gene_type:complete